MIPARYNHLSSSSGFVYTHHRWWYSQLYNRRFLQYVLLSLVVVVLPLVPVMAMMGIRPALPFGKSISTTGSATFRGNTFRWVQYAYGNPVQHLLPV